MKLDQRTLQILKNFSTININLIVDAGSKLVTVNKEKTIFAFANVEPVFEKMAIFDLSKFLSVLSLFETPELEFTKNYVTIKGNNDSINYTFAEASLLTASVKTINFPKPDIEFDISSENIQRILKVVSVLRSPEIVISGDGENISISGMDIKNPNGDNYKVVLGETDKKFSAVFNKDNIKLIPDNYNVKISSKGISCFSNDDLSYYFAVEKKHSKF